MPRNVVSLFEALTFAMLLPIRARLWLRDTMEFWQVLTPSKYGRGVPHIAAVVLGVAPAWLLVTFVKQRNENFW